MISSNDVSQMFASQNSAFMGQNSYAEQIGVSPPPSGFASGGVGSYGSTGRGGGNPFSYAPGASFGGTSGYGAGNRFASTGMSAMGGIASIGAGMAFDPFGAFLGGAMGGLARGGIGAAIGGGALAAAPMIPLAAAAQMSIGSLVRGGQQQAAISNNLNSFQFMNSGARTGQGFTRDDSKAIGDTVRSLAHIPEMMTSVEELTKMMPRLKASGVMQGVRTAAEFQSRFREAVSTIRDMSKILGTTMEEAEQFFAQSRSLGFTGRSSQLKNTLNAQFTAAQTGMDVGQVFQMQSAGAGMSRSIGGRGSQGATAISSIAQRIEAGRQSGRISEEMIQDVSGQGGALGIQGAAERMYGLMLNMRNTAAGRLVMAGAMKRDADGKVTLDDDVIQKFNRGQLGIEDLKRRASSLSNDDKISFAFRAQGSLGSQLAGSLDAGHMMQGLVGDKGRDAAALVLQRYTGGGEQDMDMMMGLGGVGGNAGDMQQMARLRAREASFRERTDPSAVLKRLSTRLKASTIGHIEQAGAKIYNELGKTFDSVMDDFLGRAAVSVSQEGAEKLAKAMAGGSKSDVREMMAAASGLKERAAGASALNLKDAQAGATSLLAVPFTGGLSLLGGTAASGTLGKIAGMIRNTDAAAFLMRGDTDTGRSMESQAEFTRMITGGGGVTDQARARQGRVVNAGLKMGGSSAAAGAQGAVGRIRAEIDNFRDMDDERKLTELRSALRSNITSGLLGSGIGGGMLDAGHLLDVLQTEGPQGADKYLKSIGVKGGMEEAMQKLSTSNDPKARDAANLLRAGIASQKAGAADMLTGIISATQGEFQGKSSQINISKALRMSGDVDIKKTIAQAQKDMDATRKQLTGFKIFGGGGLDESEAAVITGNPAARKALAEALNPDSKNSAAVRAALDIGDDEAAAKALNQLGYNVKPSDIRSMRSVQDKADAGAGSVIKAAIDAHERGEKAGQGAALLSAASNKAKEVAASIEAAKANGGLDEGSLAAAKSVQAALEGIGRGEGDSLDKLQGSVGDLVDKLQAGGKGAEGLVSATGDIGLVAQQVVEGGRGLSKKKRLTQKDVIEAFGLDNSQATREMLEAAGVAGGMGSTGVDVKELEKKVAGFKAGGTIAKKDQKETGAPETGEQKLLDSLTKIDKTLSQNTAVMTLLASKEGADIDKVRVDAAQKMLKENNPPPQ